MPYKNMPPEKTGKMDECVTKVMADGKEKESAIKICYRSIMGDMNVEDAMQEFALDPALFPMPEMEAEVIMSTGFLFTDLASLTDGKAFDGLTAGSFVDAHLQEVNIKTADLAAIVANTQKAILATKTESGEIVGLPIDARNHDKGDAAGWIVGIELAGETIRLIPRWTELGLEMISKGIQRFFSATLDLANKVFYGGTLTNWPATRDKKGKVLLRPIELSATLRTYQVDTGAADGGTRESTLATRLPVKVQTKGVYTMDITDEKLNELIAAGVEGSLGKVLEKTLGGSKPAATEPAPAAGETDLINMLGLGHLPDEAAKRIELQLQSHFEAIQKSAELQYMQRLAQLNRKHEISELAQKVTGGTEDAPRGLPVTAEVLTDALLKLPADQSQFWSDLCGKIVKGGLVEFTELGHQKELKGTVELPEEITSKLDSGELKVADLSNSILALGELSAYNLSKWQGKEEKK